MTPKEKARKLISKFSSKLPWYSEKDNLRKAKECALICVDEMLEFAYDIEWEKKEEAISKLKFLKEVKRIVAFDIQK